MKWNEMTTVQKIVSVIGWICGITYLVLSFPDLRSYLDIPNAGLYPLFSVFWVSMAISQSNKKLAKWSYIIAAGYVLLSMLDIFF